jgi:hypothetical protein
MEKSSSLPAIRIGERMDKSEPIKDSRYVYVISTTYGIVASSETKADILFLAASGGIDFPDTVVIEKQSVSRTLYIEGGGEKAWTWNQSQENWDLTKYSLS